MKWNIVAGTNRMHGVPTGEVEEKLLPAVTYVSIFDITASLSTIISARVLRGVDLANRGRDVVRLSDGITEVDLFRCTTDFPEGDLGVSCNFDGDDVPVASININFRGYYDSMTERGLVWVNPGDPGTIQLYIKPEAFKTPGMVTEILEAAEKAVRDKVLSHFQEEQES